MTVGEILPSVNAGLNATCAVLLFLGWRAVRRGDRALHRKLMLAACASSVLFLAGYFTRIALTGKTASPPIFQVISILGKVETIARLEAAREAAKPPA